MTDIFRCFLTVEQGMEAVQTAPNAGDFASTWEGCSSLEPPINSKAGGEYRVYRLLG